MKILRKYLNSHITYQRMQHVQKGLKAQIYVHNQNLTTLHKFKFWANSVLSSISWVITVY